MNEVPTTIRFLERNKGKVLTCYILYTIAKIAAVVISLAATGTTAKNGIDLFLIIYLAVDGYELLFFLVLGIFYYCGNVPISFSMTRGIQVILEV
ncbi:unnamed protein product [Blepharisma stoltei]|uniref:Uncharacterized protein n=1 Tax=Blepharisma stoltei TaxID=1481888 RepID=A0AAU9JVM1_9CILI|nr:unnamed protein product [Blepharisma stoltei]